MNDIGVLLHYS